VPAIWCTHGVYIKWAVGDAYSPGARLTKYLTIYRKIIVTLY